MDNRPNETVLLSWIEEDYVTDVEDQSYASDCVSDAPTEHYNHQTDTEQSDDSENGIQSAPTDLPSSQPTPSGTSMHFRAPPFMQPVPVYTGKDNCTKWRVHKPVNRRGKTISQNIITKLPGVKGRAKSCTTLLDCWKLFFSDETNSNIVTFTNVQLSVMANSYKNGVKDCPQTNIEELLAFFGVLYMLGVKKGNHLNTSEMWQTNGTAPEFFRAVMCERRFHQLYRAIRFDDKRTRNDRKKMDNLAPIRQVFESFVSSCNSSYTPGEYVTLDEMLEGFRGRCRFRQYISNKPDKYGIKIYALVDARTFFTVKMEIYAGKQPDGSPYVIDNSVTAVVKRLMQPIDNSGRNITMDNFYTSVTLANDLYTNHRTTIVGTIKKNKPQLPPEFLNVKGRAVGSSMFGFSKDPNCTLLVSYIPKKNKNVLMLSTLHDDDTIDPDTGDDNKPEVITFYNVTKGGVDVVDRKKKDYSVKRVNNRWPLAIFCGLLDLATVNAQIIYFSNTGDSIPRRKFITNLALELVKPHLLRRASVDVLSIGLRQSIKTILGQELPMRQNETPDVPGRKTRCAYCPVRKNRFTTVRCDECRNCICKEHTGQTKVVCNECFLQEAQINE